MGSPTVGKCWSRRISSDSKGISSPEISSSHRRGHWHSKEQWSWWCLCFLRLFFGNEFLEYICVFTIDTNSSTCALFGSTVREKGYPERSVVKTTHQRARCHRNSTSGSVTKTTATVNGLFQSREAIGFMVPPPGRYLGELPVTHMWW